MASGAKRRTQTLRRRKMKGGKYVCTHPNCEEKMQTDHKHGWYGKVINHCFINKCPYLQTQYKTR